MNAFNPTELTHAAFSGDPRPQQIADITHSVVVISELVQENLIRKVTDGGAPYLSDYELGALMDATRHLSRQAHKLAEAIADGKEGDQ